MAARSAGKVSRARAARCSTILAVVVAVACGVGILGSTPAFVRHGAFPLKPSNSKATSLHAGLSWPSLDFLKDGEPVKVPSTTKELIDALKDAMTAATRQKLTRIDIEVPPGLRLGLEGVTDPLVLPDYEVMPAQITQGDRELARLLTAMLNSAGNLLSVCFRTVKQADAAKDLWKSWGKARVTAFSTASRKKSAFGAGSAGGDESFRKCMEKCGFLVAVAPRSEQLRLVEELSEKLGDQIVIVLLNAHLRGPRRRDALRQRLASTFEPVLYLGLAGSDGGGVVYRTTKDGGGTPWILARRKLPSTVAEEVSRSRPEPSPEIVEAAFADAR